MRNFNAYPFSPYNGALVSAPIDYCGKRGTALPLTVNWATYRVAGSQLGSANPNFVVSVDFSIAGAGNLPQDWRSQSMWVDNEGVDFPVYLIFPDTQIAVPVAANSSGWFPVLTSRGFIQIAAINIPNSSITALQKTLVTLTDIYLPPYAMFEQQSTLINELGSPLVQRTNLQTPGIGPPALGDQKATVGVTFISGSVSIPQFTSAGNFLYITQIQVTVSGLLNDGNPANVQHILTSSLDGNVLIAGAVGGSNDGAKLGNPAIIYDMHCQLRFNANANWSIVVPAGQSHVLGGGFIWNIVYSINPR